ncbi:hypothetical protein B0O99DRAFT_612044 [Bisporella sp. PMI_857]|nr:hypothetical protein B0O99DRAFT_612044 [Bisporella sp. PMI_857]
MVLKARTMKLARGAIKSTSTSAYICQSCQIFSRSPQRRTHHSSNLKAHNDLVRNGPVRTRFAPSPTGNLHLGSLRTALFNYLIAKATGGQFLLRIEDTDQKRTKSDAEEDLFSNLEWAGIQWDEGPKVGGPYGPYKQSERTPIYQEASKQLLASGHAYRCFCSAERLREHAELQSKLGHAQDYDRKCAQIPKEESDDRAAKGESHVVRLLAPEIYPPFRDLVHGQMPQRTLKKHINLGYEDPILLKSDGFPTYHLANVVDDHFMNITHVVRGSEWMSSTPKHLALYQAFGWEPPKFAHIALLVDSDRQKLSKRMGHTNIRELREEGIFPETLANFVALLGWSHQEKSDVMGMQDLIDVASLKYTKGDTIVSFEKLWFLQKRHAKRYLSLSSPKPSQNITELVTNPIVRLLNAASIAHPDKYAFYSSISTDEERAAFVSDFVRGAIQSSQYTLPQKFIDQNPYFFTAPPVDLLQANILQLELPKIHPNFDISIASTKILDLLQSFEKIEQQNWNKEELKSWITAFVKQNVETILDVEGKDIEVETILTKAWVTVCHQTIRWAILGGMNGPEGTELMRVLGREECVSRFQKASEVLIQSIEEEAGGSLDG